MPVERTRWLLLTYRLPREPSRLRLGVWRRLKRVGALALPGGAWTVPSSAETQEALEWLAEEIEEAGGTVLLWIAECPSPAQDRALVARFRHEADNRYAVLAAEAHDITRGNGRARRDPDGQRRARRRLGALQRALRLERRRDYFHAPGRRVAEEDLAAADAATRTSHALDHAPPLPR